MLNDACMEDGRSMLYKYALRYFEKPIALKAAPPGTGCPLCGKVGMPLYLTGSGEASCRAQQAITCKRAARKTADDPIEVLVEGASGMTAFAEQSMIVAGPHVACVVSKLQPSSPLPPSLELTFPQKGDRARWLARMLKDPPKPPFVFAIFGKAAKFACRITTDTSLIWVNGPPGAGGYTIARRAVADLLAATEGRDWTEVADLVALRKRFALGDHDESDLARLRQVDEPTKRLLRVLPSPAAPEYSLLRNLMTE